MSITIVGLMYSDDDSTLLNATQVAAAMGVTTATLSRWWRDGDGPVRTEIGSRAYVTRGNFIAWLEARTGHLPSRVSQRPEPTPQQISA